MLDILQYYFYKCKNNTFFLSNNKYPPLLSQITPLAKLDYYSMFATSNVNYMLIFGYRKNYFEMII